MLEKKGISGSGVHCSSSTSSESDVLLQIPPLSLHHHHNHGLQELPEEGELDIGKLTLPSSGSGGGGDVPDEVDTKNNLQRKSKGSSIHSSDEIINEEEHLTISDNDIPIIPGMICNSVTANTSDADFDSAFEDSLYSGSSDDKNKNKSGENSGGFAVGGAAMSSSSILKSNTKSRRKPSNAGVGIKPIEHQPPQSSGTYCKGISELGGEGDEEGGGGKRESSPEEVQPQQYSISPLCGKTTNQGDDEMYGNYLHLDDYLDNHHHQLHEPELTLFEMEVSPANHPQLEVMPALHGNDIISSHHKVQPDEYEEDDCFSKYGPNIARRCSDSKGHKNRRVHYDDMDDGKRTTRGHGYSDEDEISEHDVGDEAGQGLLDTILLAPPLDMEVQLSPVGSLSDDMNLNVTSENLQTADPKCPPQFRGDEGLIIKPRTSGPTAPLRFNQPGKQNGESTVQPGVIFCGTPASSFVSNSSPTSPGDGNNAISLIPDADRSSEDYNVVYVVPDGGWGWMVLFGSILVNILIPGTVKSFGILFVEFLEVFDATPAAALWIPALSYWLYSSMGPFAGALATKYSHRSITIVGGLLASFGLMISYFATSIPYLYVSYGLIGGLGAGLAYPIGVFMVGQYFEKRRGLANGLCTSGSALGSVLIPPLLRVLLSEYGYRGAILIMGAILLNVCIGAMFYEPVSKHMKRTLVPRDKSIPKSPQEQVDQSNQAQIESKPSQQLHQRQVSSPIARTVQAPAREIAASMPIAIPMPQLMSDFRDMTNRRGSGNGRKATFQIGQEDESWSYQSNEVASPLAARLVKEEHPCAGTNSPNKWTFYNTGIRVRGHLPGTGPSNDSNPELETLIHSNSSGTIVVPPPTSTPAGGGAAPNLSGIGASRGQSRLNLTAIPEDDDTASETTSRQMDWTYYSALPAAKQRLLRLSVSGGTQLMASSSGGTTSVGGGSHSAHPSSIALVNQGGTGLTRTLSVASNVSNSSFHYMSTIHHGSLLTAMQFDKNIPEFASTLTLKSVRHSCCPRLSTLKGFIRKLTCGFWPKSQDEHDSNQGIMTRPGDAADVEHDSPLKMKPKRSERIKKFIDFSLLKDGMYLIMLMSNSTTAVGYTNFIVLLPSYALALGFDKSQAASLLSIVAALDFIGRIGGAALSDLQFVSRKWYYIIGLFFSGIALAFLPCARTYTSLVAMCACFGLASGTYIGVTAVILADELGAEKLGSSYGISLFLNGLLQLIGPPLCGAVYQHTGKLEPILTGLGITLIMGSLMWIFAPFIERNRARKEQLRLQMEERVGESAPAQAVQNQNVSTINTRSETSLV